jgi:hypothetical protein
MVNGCYDERIRILWMAPTVAGNVCPEQRYAELGPGESVQFQTKVGHRWMVRSAVDGRALGDVTVPSGTAVTVAVP